ncbi:hypothetical protein [Kosakonia phage Kc304]|nr:hypothetical protein [Kosakonia phage Kc304]
MKKILIAMLAVLAVGCTDADNATRLLDANGFTDIEITGYSFFSCSEKDAQSTGFIATGPTGKQVKGAVCSGLIFKNSTIRFE